MKKLGKIIQKLNLSKNSIWGAIVMSIVAAILILVKIGYKDEYSLKLSIFLLILDVCLLCIYIVTVFLTYRVLPKNKQKGSVGILFSLNTFNDYEEYRAISQKIIEKVKILSYDSPHDCVKISPVLLSFKNISHLSNKIDSERRKLKLIKRCKCMFGIFITAINQGRKGKIYQLQMTGELLRPELESELYDLLKRNFNFIFKDLKANTLNKENDLDDLQNFGAKLYFICQTIFATANEYAGYLDYAIRAYNSILHSIEKTKDKFYNQLTTILNYEICICANMICAKEYDRFIFTGEYDTKKVSEQLNIMYVPCKKLKDNKINVIYNQNKAILLFFNHKINEAQGIIDLLDKKFGKIYINNRPWMFSRAFLFAYKATIVDYQEIETYYKSIQFNTLENVLRVFNFVKSYHDNINSSINIKLALFWFIYYREDLSETLLSDDFYKDLILELDKIGLNEMKTKIKNIVDTFEYKALCNVE